MKLAVGKGLKLLVYIGIDTAIVLQLFLQADTYVLTDESNDLIVASGWLARNLKAGQG